MNKVKEKFYCKEDILIKYSGLFKTYRLDIFNNRIKYLDEAIFKKYSDYISIFLYIKDEDNNILQTREIIYNPSLPKDKKFFFNKFENFRKNNYQFTSKSDIKQLFISYCIVPHIINIDTTNYDNILGINKKFIEINRTKNKNVFFENIKNNYIRYVTFVSSVVSFFAMVSVFNKIDSLPMQTINLNILPFIASQYLIFLLFIFVFILAYGYIFVIPTKFILLKMCPKRYIMRFTYYKDLNDLLITILSIIYLIPSLYLGKLIINSWSPISSIAREYILKTQIPKILKIQNKGTNISENILYLGSDDMIYYFTDKNINHLISKNEKLYKKVCMGRDTGYIDHLMPLIEKKTFKYKVYVTVLKKDISIFPQNMSFQDTFCFTD
ncbi:MAG TPA: hypothetical protein CFH79_03080, partial [Sulfurospirillum sp. UBA11407]